MSTIDTAVTSGSAAVDQVEQESSRRKWWVLGTLALAQLIVVLDTTVVNIALPSAQRALGFGNDDRQWVVTAYALAFGSLLLLGGRLADLFGRKRMFILGLVGFALASAVGGAAQNFEMLVIARAVQGAFGAVLAPAALSLLTTTFEKSKQRSRAFAIYGAVGGGGAAVGLLLGGVLTEYLSWRWCMYINVGFAALALVGGLVLLVEKRAAQRPKLDIPGIVLVSTGLFGVVYGCSHAETTSWSNGTTLGFLIAGVVLIAAFVVVQTKVTHPALPLRVVLDRNRGGSYLAFFTLGMGLFAMFLYLTYYLQGSLGFSAVESGLAFLPLTAAIIVSSQIGELLTHRIGPRWIVGPGLAIAALGLLWLTNLGVDSTYAADVLPATIVFGLGMGAAFSAAQGRATAGVAAQDAGAASAMVSTGQQVGGSLGTALFSTLGATAAGDYISSHAGPMVQQAAAIETYTTVFGWSALALGIGAVLCGFILRGDVGEVVDSDVPAI